MDANVRCAEGNNLTVALMLGCMAGMFSCILPCGCLCLRRQKNWAASFLSTSNERVRRVVAVIKAKGWHGNHGGSSCYVVIEFKAMRSDYSQIPVRARVQVAQMFWSRVTKGSEVEIAYVIDNETDFAIVQELEDRVSTSCDVGLKLVCCMLGFFTIVGVAIAIMSVAATGCSLGFLTFVVLVTGFAAAGYFACFPLLRMCTQSRFYVSTNGHSTHGESLDELYHKADNFVLGRSSLDQQIAKQLRINENALLVAADV